jgi:UDP-N-acetylmuramoyl-tripeptide--D-alanyl-D-alanine ligase
LVELVSTRVPDWHVISSPSGGTFLVDRREGISGDQLIDAVKTLRAEHDLARLLVVSGGVSLHPEDDYDGLGPLAAAVVRLRVDQWLGVGLSVKALSTQVGLEGSWDGESLWLESPADAYDYIRAWPTGDDFIAIVGVHDPSIRSLVELIEADSR